MLQRKDGIYRKTGLEHDHPNEKEEVERCEVVRECIQGAVDVHVRPKEVFQEVRER